MSERCPRAENFTRRSFLKTIGGTISAVCVSEITPFSLLSDPDLAPLLFDPKAAKFVGIRNESLQTIYHLASWRFEVQLRDRILKSEESRHVSIERHQTGLQAHFDYGDFEVVLIAKQVRGTGFAEYILQINQRERQPFYVERVTAGEFGFYEPWNEVIVHDDGTIWKTPINLFLRAQDGGTILGLAYPYQELAVSEARDSANLGYEVESWVPAGESFETEPLFVGAYAFTGQGIFKPFDQVAYRFVTSDPQERDLGEIWTMQRYVRSKLPRHELRKKERFYMFLNSWWAGLPIPQLKGAVDLMASLGVRTVLTRESYFGIVDHISATPRLKNLPDDYRIPLPESAKKMITYAKSKMEKLATFVAPCRPFRTEWEWRSKDGKPSMYGEIRCICFACREAAEFALNLWDHLIKDSGSDFFAFDGRFLTSFNEVDLGSERIGPLPCYATNHGHKAGHNFFQDYRNGQYVVNELRRRNPGICLEIYWGFKRAYPWALASFNGCENYYESNGHQDDRMQSWYNQNYRFLPNYYNFAQIRGYNDDEFKKEILSGISISSHIQIGIGVKLLDSPKNQEFFEKWTAWAREHYQFLNVKQDLFGQPWSIPLDGSAHFLNNRGYLFLFNECDRAQVGSIPLDERIGLSSGDTYDIRQIYPDENLLTVARRGENITIPVMPSGVSVISVFPQQIKDTPLPRIVWSDLGTASVRMSGKTLAISDLYGYQGQHREIVIAINGLLPETLIVNDREIPFVAKANVVLSKVAFGSRDSDEPTPMSLHDIWPDGRFDNRGRLLVKGGTLLCARLPLGSGIYEVDMECDFTRGGLHFRAAPNLKQGIVAAALLNWFPPVDGNIGLWDAEFGQFPITWSLGQKLKKGASYRFRIDSYGDRHSFSVLNPKTRELLAGPLSYRVKSVLDKGHFGVRVQDGSALVGRFAFAPSGLTKKVFPLEVNEGELLRESFMSREITQRFGQLAPPGSRIPIGAATAVSYDYFHEEEHLWQGNGDKNP